MRTYCTINITQDDKSYAKALTEHLEIFHLYKDEEAVITIADFLGHLSIFLAYHYNTEPDQLMETLPASDYDDSLYLWKSVIDSIQSTLQYEHLELYQASYQKALD